MSFILKLNDEQVAISGGWNAALFGEKTNTSFPASVDQTYIWEHDGFNLRWVDDPPAPIPTPEEIAAQEAAQKQAQRLEDYRNESDPLFFKWQAGEIEKDEWLAKRNEIKTRY